MTPLRQKLIAERLEDRHMLTTLSIANVSLINEDSGTFSATVSLSEPSALPVSVTVSTLDAEAIGGQDFVSEIKSVTIAPGATQQTVEFEILDDSDVEPAERFTLQLVSPVNASISNVSTAVVTIFDDDAEMFFSPKRDIPSTMTSVFGLNVADINGDGLMDFLATTNARSVNEGKLMWFENDGASGFSEHVIAENVSYQSNISVADMDGDGDTDILTIPDWDWNGTVPGADRKIRWYENDGLAGFTEHIVAGPIVTGWVEAADVDSDGDVDIIAAVRNGPLMLFENDGAAGFVPSSISGNHGSVVSVADIDGDGDVDLLTEGSSLRDEFKWFENTGGGAFSEHAIPISDDFNGTWKWMVRAADIDSDGDLDLYAAMGSFARTDHKVAWYENDGSEVFTEHIVSLDGYYYGPTSRDIHAVDMDADGDLDMIYPLTHDFGGIMWAENNGSQQFVSRLIQRTHVPLQNGVLDVHPIDFDGDGDVDILSGVHSEDADEVRLGWYENLDEDTEVPTAAVANVNTSFLLDGWLSVKMEYSDNVGVAPPDSGSNDLEVITPGGSVVAAQWVSGDLQFDEPEVSASYRVEAPGGVWENGTYTIRVRDTQVRDTSGRYVVAGDVGSFEIDLSFACDFVGSGNGCDIADLDALYAGTDGAPSPLTDAAIDTWLAEASAVVNPAKGGFSHTYVRGDTDLDGVVDSTDLGRLLVDFGNPAGPLTWGDGNFNSDAFVDSVDLGELLFNFGRTSQVTAATMASAPVSAEVLVDASEFSADVDDVDDEDDEESLIDRVLM